MPSLSGLVANASVPEDPIQRIATVRLEVKYRCVSLRIIRELPRPGV
jgi:hypothetical protein